MEQNNSLKQELNNLARIEEEQIRILKEMNDGQRSENAMRQSMASRTAAMQSPYTSNRNVVSYGDGSQYSQGFSSGPQANYVASAFMNPFGDQAKSAEDFYRRNAQSRALNVLDVVSPSSNTSMTNRTLMNMDYGNRFGNAAIAGAGAVASTGVTWGLGSVLPGLAGVGVSMAGGAAVGALVGMGLDEAQQNNALSKYIYKTSSRYIDSTESNNDRGVSGFSRKDSYGAANFVRKMNDDFFMKDDDISTLLQSYTEGGMLRDVKDLQSFKDRMTSLTKTVKEGAVMLDEAYESIAGLMSEMKKLGISEKNYNSFMGMGNIIGGLTGEGGSEVIRNQTDYLKNKLAGTPHDADLAMGRLQNTTSYIATYFNGLETNGVKTPFEESNYNMIKNLGGASSAATFLDATMSNIVGSEAFTNPAMYFFDYNEQLGDFVFNKDSYDNFLKSDLSLQEIYNVGSSKLQDLESRGLGVATNRWRSQSETYIKNNLQGDDLTNLVDKTLDIYMSDKGLKSQGLDERAILGMLGVNDTGVQSLLTGFLDYKDGNPNLIKKLNLQNMWQTDTASVLAETPSFTEFIGSAWDKTKDGMTGWAVNLNEKAGEMAQNVTDWFTGYDRKIAPRYDEVFNTKSDSLKSIHYNDVVKNQEEIASNIAMSKWSLSTLQGKGYAIDDDLMGYIDKKFGIASDDLVKYDRAVISDWDSVDASISGQKDLIQQLAGGKDLSEVIVAALLKYNQTKPGGKQLDIEKTTDDMQKYMVAYGGNSNLALAASLSSQEQIDRALTQSGYNIESLRSVGMQETVAGLSLSGLNIDEVILKRVEEIVNQKIGTTNAPVTGMEGIDFANLNLQTKSGLTEGQINAVIENKTQNAPDSIMRGTGETILQLEAETGVNAMYILSHAGLESNWGTSNIAKDKNNLFGWGAVDSDPYNSAKSYDTVEDGYREIVNKIAKNYIYSDKNQQYTLNRMINDPTGKGHNYASDSGWADKIGGIMAGNYAFLGSENFTAPTSNVQTTNEAVIKTLDGNNVTAETLELDRLSQGFGDISEDNKKLNNFVDYADMINENSPSSYAGRTNKKTLEELSKDYETLRKGKAFGFNMELGNSGVSISSGASSQAFHRSIMGLSNAYGAAYDPSKSARETFESDDQLQKSYDNALRLFKDKEVGSKYLEDVLNIQAVKSETEGKDNSYQVLRAFGSKYVGLTLEDVGGDVGSYNRVVNQEAREFYDTNLNNLKDYLGGQQTEGAKTWENLSAIDKSSTYDTLNHLQDALNIEDDSSKVTLDKLMGTHGVGKDRIFSDNDTSLFQNLHKGSNGEWYYNAHEVSSEKRTYADFEAYIADGAKRSVVGDVKNHITEIFGANVDDGSSVNDLMKTIYSQRDSILEKNNQLTQEALRAGEQIGNGKIKINGLTKDESVQFANALSSGNTEMLSAIKKTALDAGKTLDSDVVDKYIELSKAINNTDISVLSSLITDLEDIVNVAKDIGNTIGLVDSAMSDVLGDDFDKAIVNQVTSVFDKDSDLGKALKGKNADDSSEIIKSLLLDGGSSKALGIELSADAVEALSESVSSALTSSFESVFDSNDTLGKFKESALYSEVISEETRVTIDGVNQSIESAVGIVESLNSELETIASTFGKDSLQYEEKMTERESLVENISETFLQSVDSLGETVDEATAGMTEAEKKSERTTKLFMSTMEKYDAAIQSSINTMNDSIDSIQRDLNKPAKKFNWFQKDTAESNNHQSRESGGGYSIQTS